jgi:hypothetical protein
MKDNKTPEPRGGSADGQQFTLRERAEWIIHSTDYSDDTRNAIKARFDAVFDINDDTLAELVRRAESGEEITGTSEARETWREKALTYDYKDCSLIYEEEHYTDLLNNRERIKGLIGEVLIHGDHDQVVALLTLIHAAASFEKQDDRRHLCIQVARICMDDVTDVWAALGAALVKRAAIDKKEE